MSDQIVSYFNRNGVLYNTLAIPLVNIYRRIRREREQWKLSTTKFQRNAIRTTQWKQELMKTIFENPQSLMPIIICRNQDGTHDILDGKQRLDAILNFFEGQFSVQFYGQEITYTQLNQDSLIKESIDTLNLNIYECQTFLTSRQKYEEFKKLNNQEKLNGAELLHSLLILEEQTLYNMVNEYVNETANQNILNLFKHCLKENDNGRFIVQRLICQSFDFYTKLKRFENTVRSYNSQMTTNIRKFDGQLSENMQKMFINQSNDENRQIMQNIINTAEILLTFIFEKNQNDDYQNILNFQDNSDRQGYFSGTLNRNRNVVGNINFIVPLVTFCSICPEFHQKITSNILAIQRKYNTCCARSKQKGSLKKYNDYIYQTLLKYFVKTENVSEMSNYERARRQIFVQPLQPTQQNGRRRRQQNETNPQRNVRQRQMTVFFAPQNNTLQIHNHS